MWHCHNRNKISKPISICYTIHNTVSVISKMKRSASGSNREHNANNKSGVTNPLHVNLRDWKFRVYAPNLGKSEVVCLTGNCLELGDWSNEKVTVLNRETESDYWFADVSLPLHVKVLYRYCICILNENPYRVMVRRWETHLIPRIIQKNIHMSSVHDDTFGELNGVQKVDNGWLTTQSVIQLKFSRNPFSFKSKVDIGKLHIKLMTTSLQLLSDGTVNPDSSEEDTTAAITEFAKLENNDCKFKPQGPFGTVYNAGDFVIMNVISENCEDLAFIVNYYNSDLKVSANEMPSHIAYSHILPIDFKKSEGRIEKSIINKLNHAPFGIMTVEYLKIHPMNESKCNLEKSYVSHWSKSWTGLDVGHRGLGASFKPDEPPKIRENTIASFNAAAVSGADMVEFDVQLSKDLKPIIYHDFYISLASKRKLETDKSDFIEMPTKNLSLEEMQILKVYHVTEGRNRKQRFFDEHLPDHQPFSLLSDVLRRIDPFIGFNIEVKWTVEEENGNFELDDPFDFNIFIDKILEVVLNSNIPRIIVFSCFNPDVCTALRLKQNIYPVMFLTSGVTKQYPSYMDQRCISIPAAIRHSINANLLGPVVHTEDLIRDPTQVKLVLDAGQVIFCWGNDNNNKETIKDMKELGLHAVIYDKMDELCDKDNKESIFHKE